MIFSDMPLIKVSDNLSDIHRNKMNILGAITVNYKLGSFEFSDKFLVVAGIQFHPITIIGYPTCIYHNIDIHPSDGGIRIMKKYFIPFSTNHSNLKSTFACNENNLSSTLDNNFLNPVISIDREIIPPGESYLLYVQSKDIPHDTDVLALPESERRKGLSLSSALYKTHDDGKFYLEVCNNLASDMLIEAGTCICDIESYNVPVMEVLDTNETNSIFSITEIEDKKLVEIKRKSQATDYPEFANALTEFLDQYQDVLAIEGDTLGCTDVIEHHINLENDTPVIYIPAYRLTQRHKEEVSRTVDEMLAENIIEPSKSPYNFPLLAVPKKDRTWRIVVDFRRLNAHTIPDRYPVPVIEDLFSSIGSNKIFTSLDLLRGFLQVPLAESSKKYTAFSTDKGHYHYLRMPFGLRSSPITFVRLINTIFCGMLGNQVIAYMDDLIIFSNTIEEHLDKLGKVFTRLREAKLKVRLEKCSFLQKKIAYLGHYLSKDGISMLPDKIKAIQEYPTPTSTKQVQQYLGMTGYYRKFIFRFAVKAAPLTNLLKKDVSFIWGEEQQNAFDWLKRSLSSPPILKFPDFNKKFFIATDASKIGVGGVLLQVHNHKLHPLAFYSRKLRTKSPDETLYSVIDLESMAVLDSLKSFRFIVYGFDITILTDHKPLIDVSNNPMLHQKRVRWYIAIQDYSVNVKYVKGKMNIIADALSRNPIDHSGIIASLQDETVIEVTNREKFVIEQKNDKYLSSVRKAIEKGKRTSRFISNLCIEDDLLVRKVKFNTRTMPDQSITQVVVPESMRQEVLEQIHEHKLAAHPGVERSYDQCRLKFYWRNMYKDIERFVKNCLTCQTTKGSIPASSPLGTYPAPKQPFDRVHLDLIVSFKETPRGNKNVLVCVDALTRFTEMFPLQSKRGAECAIAFYDNFICKHGVPATIITDSGREFNNEFLTSLCKQLDIKKINTAIYHPSSNGLVERTNRKILEILRCTLGGENPNWDQQLPSAQFTLNTSLHSSIGESPFVALYGVPARTPFDLVSQVPDTGDPLHSVMRNAQFRFSKLRERLQAANVIMKCKHDKRAQERTSQVGDKVFLKVLVRNERNYKLGKKFAGPFIVAERKGAKKFIVHKQDDNSDVREVHLDHIKVIKP